MIQYASYCHFVQMAQEQASRKHMEWVSKIFCHSGKFHVWKLLTKQSVSFFRKRQMVRNVRPSHIKLMEKDIEREKKNTFYCMHPAARYVLWPFYYKIWSYNLLCTWLGCKNRLNLTSLTMKLWDCDYANRVLFRTSELWEHIFGNASKKWQSSDFWFLIAKF